MFVWLTKSPSSFEPSIPLSSDDFMRFFINKIVSIREKINGILRTVITYVSSSTAAFEVCTEKYRIQRLAQNSLGLSKKRQKKRGM